MINTIMAIAEGSCEEAGENRSGASVVVPVYNDEHNIGKCLQSLLLQTYRPFEIIVVDDCSTDSTQAVVSQLAKDYGQIRLLQLSERSQQARARNEGWSRSRFKNVAFIDSDCQADAEWLSRLSASLQDDSSPVVQGVGYLSSNKGFWALLKSDTVRPYDGINARNLAVKKSTLIALGGFDENSSPMEDVEIGQRIKAMGIKIIHSDAKVYHNFPNSFKKIIARAWANAGAAYYVISKHNPQFAPGMGWLVKKTISTITTSRFYFKEKIPWWRRILGVPFYNLYFLVWYGSVFAYALNRRISYGESSKGDMAGKRTTPNDARDSSKCRSKHTVLLCPSVVHSAIICRCDSLKVA